MADDPKKSTRTTAAGVAGLVAVLALAAQALLDGDPNTNPDWPTIIPLVLASLGLIAARDHHVSSRAAGVGVLLLALALAGCPSVPAVIADKAAEEVAIHKGHLLELQRGPVKAEVYEEWVRASALGWYSVHRYAGGTADPAFEALR